MAQADAISQGSFVRDGLNQREAQTEALLQIIAGSDTTATAIRSTVLHILSSPRVYSTLRQEIDVGISNGNISNPIKNQEALQLPYLQVRSEHVRSIWILSHRNRLSYGKVFASTLHSLVYS